MLINLEKVKEIQICTGYTDMRKQKDGLISIVEGEFKTNIQEGTLYLFCGRNAKKLKGLYRDTDGYIVVGKEMDQIKFRWPRSKRDLRQMNQREFMRLLVGLTIE